MAKAEKERRSLQLTPEQWAHLENLAATHEALARGGPTTGKPTWRVLMRMIADGDLLVMSREAMAEGMRAVKGVVALTEKAKERKVYKSPP